MNYSVAVRTLGKAGYKYQQMLDSLKSQTIKPQAIYIYIAEGYSIPKETIGEEKYRYVPKGMVAQRALDFKEIDTEYILFLDDDVYLPPDGVEKLYAALTQHKADVISPDVFHNAQRSFASELLMTLSGRMRARKDDGKWAYKVMRNGGYSYNRNPQKDVYLSQTNAGPCFFCKKRTMLDISFQDELWLDDMPYAMGDDEVMYYKMYCKGFKILTHFGTGIVHLDAGTTLQTRDKEKTRIYCDFRFKTIFWHRFIYKPEKRGIYRQYDKICMGYTFIFSFIISLLKLQNDVLKTKISAVRDGINFLKSLEYKKLPSIKNIRL